MIALLLKLILAHLLGDFVLQPNEWVEDKRKKKLKSKYLLLHGLIHFLLLLLVTWADPKFLIGILVVGISHLLIDIGKIYIENKKYNKLIFIGDQILHFLVILLVVNYYYPIEIKWNEIFTNQNLLLLISIITITYVTSILLKILLKDLNPNKKSSKTNNAGTYIGILERLFIFLFVVINFWEGIGFLLTAKSIFRFGDLKENKDIKLTEYILIGTLLSFGIGILISLSYLKILELLSISSIN